MNHLHAFALRGTYRLYGDETNLADVQGTVWAGYPEGAARIIAQLIALGEPMSASPFDLDVRDGRGDIVAAWRGGQPQEE